VADHLGISFEGMAGVGDSDPDLTYLRRVAFSAAPANATSAVRENVEYVATRAFGEGLLEIVSLVDRQNRQTSLTVR
jgi:3-deoxy-D-manno-octulosonate 8-phosphate phosphatase KdsC-like HAD superfamily phosphatase